MNDIENKRNIEQGIQNFAAKPVREAALHLFNVLGYQSGRTIAVNSVSAFCQQFDPNNKLNHPTALKDQWKSIHLLFQITDAELSSQLSLFKDSSIKPSLLQSYMFFAVELADKDYPRGKLAAITRHLNQLFPMPVAVLFRMQDKLSIAVINRRQHKRDESKDVLGKVTLIHNISIERPHRGHVDILASFSTLELLLRKTPIGTFDQLHAAWEEVFNVELLNKRFYRELANWYFWALPQVEYPADIEKDDEKRRATGLIRLLTRLIFCWFLKEKGVVSDKLFDEADLKKILKDLSPDASTYNEAILQNLFFATLNQRMGKDSKGQPFRNFAMDEGFPKNRATYGVDTLYRYEDHFRDPGSALDHFADVPFLNGGLFECLDRIQDGTNKKLYLDGFSRNKNKRPTIPNRLFFGTEHEEDLSGAYGDTKRKKEKVRGLLHILRAYKFTLVENTPVDQEIALDPELLGKVFENLLASYNEETKTTARKQTGSFYTPRPIVEYMVDESLKAHLAGALTKAGMGEQDAETGLDIVFAYTERVHPFSEKEVTTLLNSIHTCKILDPACGSGAFPMGMLHKLVYIIHKLDPDNVRWKQLQIDAAAKNPDLSARAAAIADIERDFADNEDDYGRKLYLIENCLYGVDIQPIAIQISKLRFFISLVCDQRTNRNKKENHGIRPLPNLETKFVAADTLIGLPKIDQLALVKPRVHQIEAEIESLYHSHFAIQRRDQKLSLQKKIKGLREELGKLLTESLGSSKKAQHVADWDPFDPQASSDFFDPEWMFGQSLTEGFNVIIQNPPYISHEKVSENTKNAVRSFRSWEPFADIYCYFIERAHQLLREGGVSCSITSNSFLRADYGGPLRTFLATNSRICAVLSMDKSQVFENAIVNVAVMLYTKVSAATSSGQFIAGSGEWVSSSFIDYVESNTHLSKLNHLHRRVWSLSTEHEFDLLHQIESGNPTLERRKAKIRLGLATGANEAFLVTKSQRDDLIRKDPRCSELLKRVIRGRDVDRYAITQADQFLILSKNGVNLPSNYPVLAAHLESFGDKFKKRGAQGEHWWNLRACSFYDDFEVDRVVWIELTLEPRFAVCPAGVYMLNTAYFLLPPPGYSAHVLVALLNSSVSGFYMKHSAQTSGMGVTRWFKEHVAEIPIPNLTPANQSILNLLATCRTRSESGAASFIEDLIDACVLECYFREHMAARDLLFLDDLAPQLAAHTPDASESQQHGFIAQLYHTLNAPTSKIRNRLLRISADSPDLLAVIKQESKA